MGNSYRKSILPLARKINLHGLTRLAGNSTIFPFYHVVSNDPLPHIRHLYHVRSVAQFEKDLEVLLALYHPLSLKEHLDGVKPSKGKRNMVLSFDDGLSECYHHIAPILKREGVPAVFFLNNDFIDNAGLFYRYKTGLILEYVLSDCRAMESAAEFLAIPQEQVVKAIQMVKYKQQPLLDALAKEIELNFIEYQEQQPVYMSTAQIRELLEWGFEIGGHSPDHASFDELDEDELLNQVSFSILDLQKRFGVKTRYFSFPFTSAGVSARVIHELIDKQLAKALLGTAGLKKTARREFIQRIPMEAGRMSGEEILKLEYLYYLLKMPLGKNRLNY
jgi:peptidoglycan/xylan/chitin deacetylase (PgdA/CDA1 family)